MTANGTQCLSGTRRRFWYRFITASILGGTMTAVVGWALTLLKVRFSQELSMTVVLVLAMLTLTAAWEYAAHVRSHAFERRSPLPFAEFLSSADFSDPVSPKLASAVLKIIGSSLHIPTDRIYPSDRWLDLLYPARYTDINPLCDPPIIRLAIKLAAPEVRLTWEEAEEICKTLGDNPTVAQFLLRLDSELRSRSPFDS
jgi:hypothetical protein